MSVTTRKTTLYLILIALFTFVPVHGQVIKTIWNIGFFEAGDYPSNSKFREHFRDQLTAALPEGYEVVFVPQGFKSADWNRDSSRTMAAGLVADRSVDLVVTMGPWTVEDLLEAGFDRPVVAAFRFDPMAEGLTDSLGRPIADNLTVRIRPGKLESDIRVLTSLTTVGRLGFLSFPSVYEPSLMLEKLRQLGKMYQFEVVTAEGYDNEGTYAFFKAYREIDKNIDALYLPPLWGCDATKMRNFYAQALHDGIAVMSSGGEYDVSQGAFAAGSGESVRVTSACHVWKVKRIIQGTVPADLPTMVPDFAGVCVSEFAASLFGI
ncbi:MAG: hypothetical protein DRP45_09435, partial [Candidatus Zixiibacteriota bacterium]